MIFRNLILGALLFGTLASCSLAPKYTQPSTAPIPEAYKENKDWQLAKPADAIERGEWWKIFGDEKLNDLESKVASSNQDLKAAIARYDQARAVATQANAAYFPTVTANASESRNQLSHNITSQTTLSLYNENIVGVDLSYELDIWGRVRNSAKAAGNLAQASAADKAVLDLSIHAELATDYFNLRALDKAQVILGKAIDAYQKAYDLTNDRHNGGIASEADVDQAKTQLENAKTQSAESALQRAQMEHAIAILVGEMPSSFKIDPVTIVSEAPTIDAGLPSTLLERRPDIAAAERRVSSANAEIGVARAAYFPTISLDAMFGFESITRSTLFNAPSQFWSLGPSAVMTLFDAGKIHAMNDQARAAYNETIANYRETVLTAFKEAEDNLVAIKQLEQENTSQTAATEAAEKALTQAQDRYKGGIATYLDVVVSQNTALQAELASNDILTRRINARIALIKALGGGWNLHDDKAVNPK